MRKKNPSHNTPNGMEPVFFSSNKMMTLHKSIIPAGTQFVDRESSRH